MNVHRLITVAVLTVSIVLFVFSPGLATSYKELLFFGILEEQSPGLHATFENMLRNRLAAESGIRITDIERTRAFRDRIEFFRYPVVSTDNLQRLRKMLPDSMVFCWGKIMSADVSINHKTLLRSVVKGKVTAAIIIYDPELRRFLFDGEVTDEKEFKGPLFFPGSPDKTTTVNAAQRMAILEELLDNVASKSESLIASLVQNNQEIADEEKPAEPQSPNAPSISDVFSVPSVEPARIIDSEGTDSTANRRAGGNTGSAGTK